MVLKDKNVVINLSYDEDGYALIDIQTIGNTAELERPCIEVKLNNMLIHDMFDGEE
jgi:hypothetical protein